MSEQTSVVRTERDGVFEMGAAFVGAAARIGLTIASAPLVLLPRGSRRRVRRAMVEVARAVVVLPKELANVSERVVDDIFTGPAPTFNLPNLPSPDRIGERARAFTERLAKAADEFGASVGRAANRAADGVERTAAKVDEWVEKPPTTPSA
ncbi:hypothetical protein EYB53_002740 [Candidatus Chloroploca sp. M-50]|uniref:YtxH domain-containing protein n=1 Tax=Candidatus Chloroploca mongolica TaxID=2528176 RepID=A0ABS4D593_9CHLR|nr:hypothetical protein [Candidatus Chloroploca mongolica]MBP1464618.1 hypothetical protein [Candidatus Chloroploca mongolica]